MLWGKNSATYTSQSANMNQVARKKKPVHSIHNSFSHQFFHVHGVHTISCHPVVGYIIVALVALLLKRGHGGVVIIPGAVAGSPVRFSTPLVLFVSAISVFLLLPLPVPFHLFFLFFSLFFLLFWFFSACWGRSCLIGSPAWFNAQCRFPAIARRHSAPTCCTQCLVRVSEWRRSISLGFGGACLLCGWRRWMCHCNLRLSDSSVLSSCGLIWTFQCRIIFHVRFRTGRTRDGPWRWKVRFKPFDILCKHLHSIIIIKCKILLMPILIAGFTILSASEFSDDLHRSPRTCSDEVLEVPLGLLKGHKLWPAVLKRAERRDLRQTVLELFSSLCHLSRQSVLCGRYLSSILFTDRLSPGRWMLLLWLSLTAGLHSSILNAIRHRDVRLCTSFLLCSGKQPGYRVWSGRFSADIPVAWLIHQPGLYRG